MKPIPALDLAKMLRGTPVGVSGQVTGFALDSREVRPGFAFLAVRGAQVDGHAYVAQAFERGACVAVVEEPVEGPHILVANLVEALADMARHFRAQMTGPVVGVTGSAGKTSAKEFLAAALSPLGTVLKTEANRNTEYSAPLLWAEWTPDHSAAVVEMGMRGFGQIAHLASFSKPTVGVVTNVGWSHIDLVESRGGIARAKGELLGALPADGLAILWAEDDFYATMRDCGRQVRSFGFSNEADCQILRYVAHSWTDSEIAGTALGQHWHCRLPAAGRHMALNAACAILVAASLGVPAQQAADRLIEAQLPPMRMEVRSYNGATILLDAYNAAPPSVLAALDTLKDLAPGRTFVVLGEMRELGAFAEEAHRAVGIGVAESGVEEAIFFGDATRYALEEASARGVKGEMAHTIEDVTRFLRRLAPGDTVLVKGSRALALERALAPLEEKDE